MKSKVIPKYRIGDWVKVKAKVFCCYMPPGNKDIKVEEYSKPVVGQIIGLFRMYRGKVATIFEGEMPESGGKIYSHYLKRNNSELLWQVKNGYTNKPILARDEDVEPVEPPATIGEYRKLMPILNRT